MTIVGLSLQWKGSEALAAGAEAIVPPTASPDDTSNFNANASAGSTRLPSNRQQLPLTLKIAWTTFEPQI